jgi:hypothetical protein
VITAYSYASEGNEHYILSPTSTAAGSMVARTMDDIFDGVAAWPGNVYELQVDPPDVMQQGAHVLRVRKYDVVRVVPREQVFGSNFAKLDAFITELRTFDWMRPSSEDRRPRAAVLVAEHYAALRHYDKRVGIGDVRIVRDIDKVEPSITAPFPLVSPEGTAARAKAHAAAARAIDSRLNLPRKEAFLRVVASIVAPRAWRIAWEHVAAAHLRHTVTVFREERGGALFDDLSGKVIERTARALEVAMEPGLEELVAKRGVFVGGRMVQRQSVERTVAAAQMEIPTEWGVSKERFDAIVAGLVERVWFYAWRFITHANAHAGWHAFHLASDVRQPDPWGPWVGLYRLGLWPLADDGVDMTVYDPPVVGE